ncbi:MAG: ribosome small subunit-dependent GTPase A [Myxococcales bacterium]|nr:ribosome small subunit-dependent GTPase A [Myxococcales bacterium]
MTLRPRSRTKDRAAPRAPRAPAGRVVDRRGPVMVVERPDGSRVPCVGHGKGKRAVVGDRVFLGQEADTELAEFLVTGYAERDTELVRADAMGRKPQTLAANVTRVFVVCAIEPPLRLGLIDRYLVACEQAGIEGLVLFNKVDLLGNASRATVNEVLAPYPAAGYRVLAASAESGEGIEAVRQALVGHTSIFVGHSGVGKTSLLNALDPGLGEKVRELSDASGRGQHTTTTASLYHVPGGGDVIDSPGVRGFAPWGIDPRTLRDLYPELRALADGCRFADCQHIEEPGCAVQAAIAEGEVDEARYESYVRLRGSLTGEVGRFY